MMRLFLFFFIFFFHITLSSQNRLVITPEMVYNLSGHGNEEVLFDDQRLENITECDYTPAENPYIYFDGVWNGKTFHFPVEVVIDLGASYKLSNICTIKGGGLAATGVTEIYDGGTNPTTWNLLYQYQRDSIECKIVDIETQFLKFTFLSPLSRIREIELYGPEMNLPICPPDLQNPANECGETRFPMQEFIGSNTNFDIPPAKGNAVGFIRNYHGVFRNTGFADPNYEPYPNSIYDWWTNNDLTGEVFQLDRFFQGLTDLGLPINNVIHRAPPYLVTFAYENGDPLYNATSAFLDGTLTEQEFIRVTERKPFSEELYPIFLDMKVDQPEMYLEYSDFFYQFAARYGSNPNANQLKIADDNVPVSGLGNVQYIENWNEPDKWWHIGNVQRFNFLDPQVEEQLGYFSPFEYAAMSSATYDGGGKMDSIENIVLERYPNDVPMGAFPISVHSADENMKQVMAGISELNTKYIRAMKFWFDHYRPDIGFPFDVISFHDYSNNGFGRVPLADFALSPEEYGLKDRLKPLVAFRDRYLPEVEIWLSEFGYDTNPVSIQGPSCRVHCDDCGSQICEDKMKELQGQWLVRSFLEIAAAGVDRAMVFNMRDGSDSGSKGLYQTSGLTSWRLDGFQNKPSWYYIATTKNILKDTKFDPAFSSEEEGIRLYRFADQCDSPNKEVYAIWSPTSERGDDTAIFENYELPFIVGSTATLIELVAGDIDGIRTPLLADADGKIKINVSERPKYIVVGELKSDVNGCACEYIPFTLTGNGNIETLNDEQDEIGSPYCGEGGSPKSRWNAAEGDEVIIDLGGKHELSSLFFHSDTLAEGVVEIYTGEAGNWELFSSWKVGNFTPFRWKMFSNFDTLQTRYIRLKALSNQLNLQELAFCGTALEPIISPVANTWEELIEFNVSPNPFNKQFDIQTSEKGILMITDAIGKIILKTQISENQLIRSDKWQAGIYFLQLQNEKGQVLARRKVVKTNK